MERYRTTHMSYEDADDPLPVTGCMGELEDFYQFGFDGAVTASAFKAQATPIGVQESRDTLCGVLAVDQAAKSYSLLEAPTFQKVLNIELLRYLLKTTLVSN